MRTKSTTDLMKPICAYFNPCKNCIGGTKMTVPNEENTTLCLFNFRLFQIIFILSETDYLLLLSELKIWNVKWWNGSKLERSNDVKRCLCLNRKGTTIIVRVLQNKAARKAMDAMDRENWHDAARSRKIAGTIFSKSSWDYIFLLRFPLTCLFLMQSTDMRYVNASSEAYLKWTGM